MMAIVEKINDTQHLGVYSLNHIILRIDDVVELALKVGGLLERWKGVDSKIVIDLKAVKRVSQPALRRLKYINQVCQSVGFQVIVRDLYGFKRSQQFAILDILGFEVIE